MTEELLNALREYIDARIRELAATDPQSGDVLECFRTERQEAWEAVVEAARPVPPQNSPPE